MALDENNGSPFTMPVVPAYGGGYGGNGGLFGNGDLSWLILLLLCGWGGGWGMGGFGGGWGGMMGMGFDFPWLLTGQNGINTHISDGFRDAQISDQITSVRDGISALSNQICDCCGTTQMSLANGFNGVTSAVTGAQNALAQQFYSNELASLNRSFAEQTANTAGFNGVQSTLCDIRYGSATNTRDIIDSQTRGTQAILDKLCALELDGYKRENDQLRTQLSMADLRASQTAQTAELRQSGATQLNQLVSELRSCPIPAQPVYGNQPIFQCSGPAWNNNGCGCGNNGFVN